MQVFVYGTLKTNGVGYFYCGLNYCEFLGRRVAQNCRLIRINGRGFNFPALLPSEGDTVSGELFAVDNETFERMKGFENAYYQPETVCLADGSTATTFRWACDSEGYPECPKDRNGDYYFPLHLQNS